MPRWIGPVTLLATLLLWVACDDPRPTGPGEVLPAALDVQPAVCEESTVALIADEVVQIGTVRIGNDESTLYVTFDVSPEHAMATTRLAVSPSVEGIPTNGSGHPVPGKFPWSTRHRPRATTFTYAIPLETIPAGAGSAVVIAAFAEEGGSGAWSDGPRFSTDGPWATYTPYTTATCTQAPTAVISSPDGPAALAAGTPLAFDGSTSTDPVGGGLVHHWGFGDGTMGGGAQIAHVFASGGTYLVTLTVTDANGATDTDQVEVNVTSPPPPSAFTSLRGSVTDPAGDPLADVHVGIAGGASLGTTDGDGKIEIADFPAGTQVLLTLVKDGYGDGFVPLKIAEDATHAFFDATLRPRNAAQVIADAAAGGAATGEDGVSIVLPPGALVDAGGNPVSGPVDVAMTPIDVSGSELGAFPGQFTGILPDGSSSLIVSFGAAEFVVSQNGEALQLAPGARATIRLPIYTSGAGIGDAVPVWSLDEASGLWVQEGIGQVIAGSGVNPVLEAEVGHLSFWNADRPESGVQMDLQCQGVVVLLQGKCSYVVESIGGDWAYRTLGETDSFGTTVTVAPNTLYRLSAFAFDDSCILQGGLLLDQPAENLGEITILLECLTADDVVRLQYGDRLDAEIAAGGELDRYVFAGSAGDEIRIDFESDLNGVYRVIDPAGGEVAAGPLPRGASRQVFRTLQLNGDHIIEVSGELAEDTGPYTIGLALHQPDPVTSLTLPASAGGELGFPTEVDAFTFEGSAGDEISVAAARGADGTLNGTVSVYSPTGVQVMQDPFGNSVGARALALTETGTYRVELTPTSSLPGSYQLDVRAAPATAIQDGDEIAATLATTLEVDAFTFSGTPGDVVRLDLVRPAAGPIVRARIHGPDGALVGDRPFDDDPPQQIFVTLDAGEYRTSIFSNLVGVAGDYHIAYTVFAPEPPMALAYGDEITEEIGFPVETDTWVFAALAGDEVQLNVSTAPGSRLEGDVRLISPANAIVAQGSYTQVLGFGATETLGESGQYRVEVTGDVSSVPGDYVIALQQQGGPEDLPFGERIEATMDAVGEVDEYSFTGAAGDLVRIHGATADGSTLRALLQLEDPNGIQVTAAEGVLQTDLTFNTVVTLPATGTYTLLVTAQLNAPGGYQIAVGSGIGRRDATLSSGGVVSTPTTSDGANVLRLRALPGDAFLSVGTEKMRRYLANGTLDPSFGVSGIVDILADGGGGSIEAVAVQPDGGILVAGQANDDWVVLRYTATGTLDGSFGTGGIVVVETGVTSSDLTSGPKDIRFLQDGADLDILIGGKVRVGTGQYDVAIARLDADGSPDAGFAGGGLLTATHVGVGVAMEVQSTGRIVLTGHSSQNNQVIAVGYNPDGTLDTTFGVGGTATITVALPPFARGMTLRPDDRFVVLGELGTVNALAVGFTADGAVDATFGSSGVATVDYGHTERFWEGTADAAGRIVIAGEMRLQSLSGEGEAFVARLLPDGTPDPTFGLGGFVVEDLPDRPRDLALDGQGRLLVGGDRPVGSFRAGNIIRLLMQ